MDTLLETLRIIGLIGFFGISVCLLLAATILLAGTVKDLFE